MPADAITGQVMVRLPSAKILLTADFIGGLRLDTSVDLVFVLPRKGAGPSL